MSEQAERTSHEDALRTDCAQREVACRPLNPRRFGTRLHLTTGSADRDGESIRFTRRELSLIVPLITARRPLRVQELADAVYPDGDPVDARNAIKVHIWRLRMRLGRDFITTAYGSYRLNSAVGVDLFQYERLARASTMTSAGNGEFYALASTAFNELRVPRPFELRELGAFCCLEQRFLDAAHQIGRYLIENASSHGSRYEAVSIARALLENQTDTGESRNDLPKYEPWTTLGVINRCDAPVIV